MAFIIACAAAANMKTPGGDQIAAFTAVWTVLLLVIITAFGSAILRRHQTSLAIGVLLGIMFIVCQQMLIIFAIFVERSQTATDPASVSAQQAMATFSFFIFIVYGVFGTALAVYRNDIIKSDAHANLEEVSGEGDQKVDDKNTEFKAQNSL